MHIGFRLSAPKDGGHDLSLWQVLTFFIILSLKRGYYI